MDKKDLDVKSVLVTGSDGFIGKNLIEGLQRKEDVKIKAFDIEDNIDRLTAHLKEADIVFHLAGVNRPEDIEEFELGNTSLTKNVVNIIEGFKRNIPIVFSSSIQATLDNPYGISKKKAEDILIEYSQKSNAKVYIYRFPNVFGKWCRPNYNSVVATFCYNISRGLDITISDANKEIEVVYIDDIISAFLGILDGRYTKPEREFYCVSPTFHVRLGKLADTIQSFRDSRRTLHIADFSERFTRCLYATYLSYLPKDDFAYALEQHMDSRGELAELLKSPHFGQIFVSRTRPGITRGNHYHDTKAEKFVVLSGDAVIRFRHILNEEVIDYPVSGRDFRIVDIPPGYTHSIKNVGQNDLIVLFWANEILDISSPDTYPLNVERERST